MSITFAPAPNAALVLADGTVFSGYGVGAPGVAAGELCFNTSMTGYQEILTDPSYTGQMICFTFPHIGNVGTNLEDMESDAISVRSPQGEPRAAGVGEAKGARPPSQSATGIILREAITEPSSWRATSHFNDWLVEHGIIGISGIDTRALTRHLRAHGAQNGAIAFQSRESRIESLVDKARKALINAPDMHGLELAAHVTTKASYTWNQPRWELGGDHSTLDSRLSTLLHVVAIDYGIKHNILRSLVSVGCEVTLVPATATAEEILALNSDGVLLSNGPGDPSATAHYAVPTIRALLAAGLPIMGICLGHQLLGLALGAKTEKMAQGHRGANHPVQEVKSGKVSITSQNHGFSISDKGLPAEIEVTHRSLFDGTIQGIRHRDKLAFSVQGHPEASPGPQDAQELFAEFVGMMRGQDAGLSIQDSGFRIQGKRA